VNILKEFELVGEHWRENIQGVELSQRLFDAMHSKARKETRSFILEELKKPKPSISAGLRESVAVAVTDQKHMVLEAEINHPNDLILDNFGEFWAAHLHGVEQTTTTSIASLVDDANVSQNLLIYGDASIYGMWNHHTYEPGVVLAVGSGSSAAARDDYCIETPFGSSPEDSYFNCGNGSYAAGYISTVGSVSAGGSGTVNEVGLFLKAVNWTAMILKTFMLFHDILGSGIPFSAGNIINVSYSIAI